MSVASLSHLTYSVDRETQSHDAAMTRTASSGVVTGNCDVQELSAGEAQRYQREGMTVSAKAYIDGTPDIRVNDKFTADSRTYMVRAIKIQRRRTRFTVLILDFIR